MFNKSEHTYRMIIEFTNKNVDEIDMTIIEAEKITSAVSELVSNSVLKIAGNGAIRFYNMSNINSIKFIEL